MRLSPAPRGALLYKKIINLVGTFFPRGLKGPKSLACVFFHSSAFNIHLFQSLGNWTSRLDQGGSSEEVG